MSRVAFKDTKGIDKKVNKYLQKVEEQGGAPTLPGISRALGITPKTFKEYANGLIPNALPEVTEKFQDIYLMVQEYLEETCLGVNGGKGGGPGAKWLLANHYGMSDKTSVDVEGSLAVYRHINDQADRSVEDIAEELEEDINKETKKGGK